MKKKTDEKELYLAPAVEVLHLATPLSFLVDTFSGTGSVGDFGEGNADGAENWGLDGGEPEDWFD